MKVDLTKKETGQEIKQAPKKGVPDRIKKQILLVAAAVLILAGVIAGCMVHKRTIEEYRHIADALLYRTHWLSESQREEMLQGAGIWGPKYLKIKDKDRFREILAEQFQLMTEEKEMAGSSMDFQGGVNECVAVLDQQGIRDETIRESYQAFMKERKEGQFSSFAPNPLKRFFKDLRSAESDFYTEGIVTDSEMSDLIRGKVDGGLAQGDFETVSDALDVMAGTGYTDVCYPDINTLLDQLQDVCEVYAVSSGNHAYYDGVEDESSSKSRGLDPAGMGSSIGTRSSSSSTTYHGDFSVMNWSSSTHYDGLVDQESKNKYNSSSSGRELSFRGMEAGGPVMSFRWAAQQGAAFALCGRHEPEDQEDSGLEVVLLMNGKKLFIPGNSEMGPGGWTQTCYVIEGDFTSLRSGLRQEYQDRYSLDAWYTKAQAQLEAGDLSGALELFRMYPKLTVSQDALVEIGKGFMKAGSYQEAFEALGLTEQYRTLEGETKETVIKRLREYDPEYSERGEFPQVFCRLMAQCLDPLTGEEIQKALIGRSWTGLPRDMYRFDSDGTGADRDRFGVDHFTWTISGDLLQISYGASPAEYRVYDLFGAYYYLDGPLHLLLTPYAKK